MSLEIYSVGKTKINKYQYELRQYIDLDKQHLIPLNGYFGITTKHDFNNYHSLLQSQRLQYFHLDFLNDKYAFNLDFLNAIFYFYTKFQKNVTKNH